MTTATRVRAIDADGHVSESASRLLEHLEPPYRDYYATGGVLRPSDAAPRNLGTKLARGRGNSREAWLEMMALGDLETAIVYPTGGLGVGFIKDPDFAVAYCRAYNAWLANEMVQPSAGLLGVAVLAPQEPAEAAKELRRIKQELHLTAAMLPADGISLLGHRSFDVLYSAAQELDVPVSIHASGSWLADAFNGASLFPKFIQAHTVSHPFGILRQFTSMMFEGVFQRFPSARFAFLECGGTWVPWWLDRMDEEWEHRGADEAPGLTRKPSSLVHEGGNIFFGCEAAERLLGATLNAIGDDTIMYASDWPHWDGDYPNSLMEMRAREDLTENQRLKVLRGAAQRFYGLSTKA